NYGMLYPALLKLEQEGSIASEWGVSENNRKAKFYKLTRAAGSNWRRKRGIGSRRRRSSDGFSLPRRSRYETSARVDFATRRPVPEYPARAGAFRRDRESSSTAHRRQSPLRNDSRAGPSRRHSEARRRRAGQGGVPRTKHNPIP